jgi:prevent-host-death family protein
MQTISVSELRHNLGLYLEKVKDGDEIIIEEENQVIARISPLIMKKRVWLPKV